MKQFFEAHKHYIIWGIITFVLCFLWLGVNARADELPTPYLSTNGHVYQIRNLSTSDDYYLTCDVPTPSESSSNNYFFLCIGLQSNGTTWEVIDTNFIKQDSVSNTYYFHLTGYIGYGWGYSIYPYTTLYSNFSLTPVMGTLSTSRPSGMDSSSFDFSSATITPSTVLSGYTGYGSDGTLITGTYIAPTFDFSGADVLQSKILNGYKAYDSTGTLITGTALSTPTTCSAEDILEGETAYDSDGNLITGTLVLSSDTSGNDSGGTSSSTDVSGNTIVNVDMSGVESKLTTVNTNIATTNTKLTTLNNSIDSLYNHIQVIYLLLLVQFAFPIVRRFIKRILLRKGEND